MQLLTCAVVDVCSTNIQQYYSMSVVCSCYHSTAVANVQFSSSQNLDLVEATRSMIKNAAANRLSPLRFQYSDSHGETVCSVKIAAFSV